jgi:hypothetical protein
MSVPILCAECTVATVDFERGWRGYLADHEYEPTVVVILCPECSESEFGPYPSADASGESRPDASE